MAHVGGGALPRDEVRPGPPRDRHVPMYPAIPGSPARYRRGLPAPKVVSTAPNSLPNALATVGPVGGLDFDLLWGRCRDPDPGHRVIGP